MRVVLRQLLLVRARQFDLEFAGYVSGDVALQRNQVGLFAVVLLAPNHVFGLHIDQFQIQRQVVTTLSDASIQNGLDIQFLADSFWIGFFAFVAKD